MNCREAGPLIDDLLDRDLDAAARRALERHLARCEACAARHDDLLAVDRWARAMKPAAPAVDFTQRVMARVQQEPQPAATAVATDHRIAWILGLVAALVIAPLVLTGAGRGWASATVNAVGAMLRSTASDVAAAAQELLEALGSVLGSIERVSGPIPSLWLLLGAAMAFAATIVFNYALVRRETRREQ